MTCATLKKKAEVIYPPQWLNRTGLEEEIFDEPFPGVGLRTEDLDVPTYSSFFASPDSPPKPGAKSGLDSAPVQPAPVQDYTKTFEKIVDFVSIVFALVVTLVTWLVVFPHG